MGRESLGFQGSPVHQGEGKGIRELRIDCPRKEEEIYGQGCYYGDYWVIGLELETCL